ncbi:MAG: NADH-quinone oxidoreductase subunit NuoF [Halanaerobiaceae bacterium]
MNKNTDKKIIAICGGTGCQGSEAQKVIDTFVTELKKRHLETEATVKVTGCPGFCEQGPLAVILPQEIFYVKIEPGDVANIIESSILKDEVIEELLYKEDASDQKIIKEKEVPFYKHQKRIVFEHNGRIDPTSIDEYIEVEGYSALSKVLNTEDGKNVVEEIKESGLRGRGGAGFPTGTKWEFARNSESEIKYVVCNADEGDPGAFMDRGLLEGNPHLVIEGMTIGAYAIGASRGYIYVRTEYPLAVKNIQKAIDQAREYGFLGDNIFGTDFSFDLEIRKGAGAFVAGEETALLHSIEGKRAMPTQRPPYPATSGLWGEPTNINNVETWANVPYIIRKGAEWFKQTGTEDSKGTKVFSLVGKINNTGLIEVPMGITLREIIFEIGGGIPEGKEFKAVQTGGPSGGCIPAEYLDLQVDYEKLSAANSMMGSGGMVVMDEDTCMVDVAKYFLEFLREESCGKCPPCRIGVPKMLKILTRITEGKGQEGDLEQLAELGEIISSASLCGLGQTSANPVLSTLEHFRKEYEKHIYQKECPARVCSALMYYEIDSQLCRSCDRCKQICPVDAIEGTPGEGSYEIIDQQCIKCGNCYDECPFEAIKSKAGQKERVL